MMKIKFNNPRVNGSNNPFEHFDPSKKNQYPKGSGVYIYGFRKEIDNIKVFIPIYVGIAKNLSDRIWLHYNEEKQGGNSKWYVFDYASLIYNKDVSDLYADMLTADSRRGIDNSRYSNKLIWFNHSSFFNWKLNVSSSVYKSDSGVQSSIKIEGDLDNIQKHNPNSKAGILKNRIVSAKEIFNKDFYFVYCSLDNSSDVIIEEGHELCNTYNDYKNNGHKYMVGRKNGPGKKICEKIEHLTKIKLFKLGIYTAAKSHGKLVEGMINLKDVQKNLIVLKDQQMTNKQGVYKTLIY